MRIENELQLDFKDVLIRPKRSFLSSRSEVSLVKNYQFKWAKYKWTGVPIIAANMDTVGTISSAKVLASHHCMTALHKHYSVEQLIEFFGPKSSEEDNGLG